MEFREFMWLVFIFGIASLVVGDAIWKAVKAVRKGKRR